MKLRVNANSGLAEMYGGIRWMVSQPLNDAIRTLGNEREWHEFRRVCYKM